MDTLPFQLFPQITTWHRQTLRRNIVCQENAFLNAFIECFGWVEIVRSVPTALIILTWKCDSHPTSQGSLTPGKLDLAFLIHDLHRNTKDLTSPVSQSTETADGKWNVTLLKPKVTLESQQHLSGGGKKWPVWFSWWGTRFLQQYLRFK